MRKSFGERCYSLATTQHEWIHRRVESINFEENGETRRRISFDYALTSDLLIHYVDLVGYKKVHVDLASDSQVVVPLTFMRKGELNNLDARGSDGSSIPVLGYTDNGKITTAALEFAFDEAFPQSVNTQAAKFGIKEIIYSKFIEFKNDIQNDVDRRSGASHREEWLEQNPDADNKRKLYLNHVIDCLERNEEPRTPPLPSEVGYWTYFLFQEIKKSLEVNSEKNPRKDHFRIQFLSLLLTLTESYLFAVLVEQSNFKTRNIIKISFDSKKTISSTSGWRRFLPQEFMGATVRLPVALSTYGAKSTHLEFNTTSTMDVGEIFSDVTTQGNLHDSARNSGTVNKVGNRLHLVVNHRARIPMMTIELKLKIRRSQLFPTAILAFLSLALSICAFAEIRTRDPLFAKYYSADNALALFTLIFAVWAVTLLTGNRSLPDDRWIIRSTFCQCLSLVAIAGTLTVLTISTDTGGNPNSISSQGLIWWVQVFFISCCMALSLLSIHIFLWIYLPSTSGSKLALRPALPGRLGSKSMLTLWRSQDGAVMDESETCLYAAVEFNSVDRRKRFLETISRGV